MGFEILFDCLFVGTWLVFEEDRLVSLVCLLPICFLGNSSKNQESLVLSAVFGVWNCWEKKRSEENRYNMGQ